MRIYQTFANTVCGKQINYVIQNNQTQLYPPDRKKHNYDLSTEYNLAKKGFCFNSHRNHRFVQLQEVHGPTGIWHQSRASFSESVLLILSFVLFWIILSHSEDPLKFLDDL